MKNFKNSWGLYPWFIEEGEDSIHQNDIEKFKQLNPYCKVFYCKSNDEQYLTICYNQNCYKVKPKLYEIIPTPKFTFGNKVNINDKAEYGEVIEIMWHYSKAKEFYHLKVNGKKKKKRYYSEDLKLVD